MGVRDDAKQVIVSIDEEQTRDLAVHLYSCVLIRRIDPLHSIRRWAAWPLPYAQAPDPSDGHTYFDDVIPSNTLSHDADEEYRRWIQLEAASAQCKRTWSVRNRRMKPNNKRVCHAPTLDLSISDSPNGARAQSICSDSVINQEAASTQSSEKAQVPDMPYATDEEDSVEELESASEDDSSDVQDATEEEPSGAEDLAVENTSHLPLRETESSRVSVSSESSPEPIKHNQQNKSPSSSDGDNSLSTSEENLLQSSSDLIRREQPGIVRTRSDSNDTSDSDSDQSLRSQSKENVASQKNVSASSANASDDESSVSESESDRSKSGPHSPSDVTDTEGNSIEEGDATSSEEDDLDRESVSPRKKRLREKESLNGNKTSQIARFFISRRHVNSKEVLLNAIFAAIVNKVKVKAQVMRERGLIDGKLDVSPDAFRWDYSRTVAVELATKVDKVLNTMHTLTTVPRNPCVVRTWRHLLNAAVHSEESPYTAFNTRPYERVYPRCEKLFENIKFDYQTVMTGDNANQSFRTEHGFDVIKFLKHQDFVNKTLNLKRHILRLSQDKVELQRLKALFYGKLSMQKSGQKITWRAENSYRFAKEYFGNAHVREYIAQANTGIDWTDYRL